MLTLTTKTLGTLEIGFQHFTGDADVELRRILTGHHLDNGAPRVSPEGSIGLSAREKVNEDLKVLARLASVPRLHVLVDVGDRRTVATVRPTLDNKNFAPDTEYIGVAFVNPVDQYKKEEGRVLALNRAIDEMGVADSVRREILAAYYQR